MLPYRSSFVIISVIWLSHHLAQCETASQETDTIDIKIGFLLGSKRFGGQERTCARPECQLVYAFNYGLDKINQLYSKCSNSSGSSNSTASKVTYKCRQLRFVPTYAETYGIENESIKRTIELLDKHQVHSIVGPQETCQVESRLASTYNVAMISHYCPQWLATTAAVGDHQQGATFIQTKPPHWKIAERVIALIEELFHTMVGSGQHPQQVVLLYFTEEQRKRMNSSHSGTELPPMANDASQYKLIGELLEIKLNQLIEAAQKQETNGSQSASGGVSSKLTVLNWHTTFHYGFTKNPFRQLIRRHLFQSVPLEKEKESSLKDKCAKEAPNRLRQSEATNQQRATIYIVVGHYYEHLGLMLALDELNLFGRQQEQQQQQSSVLTVDETSGGGGNRRALVIGVDIEQYDERDDSVRFLRGLLMDSGAQATDRTAKDAQQRQSGAAPNQVQPTKQHESLDSIADMYRHYMGVVPAKPTRMAEFFEGLRSMYTSNRSVVDQTAMDARLLQFIRLPIEALYLYDSLQLLGSYFDECLNELHLDLGECGSGRRVFDWFKGRKYASSIDANHLTAFDGQAQSEGLYSLITRRITTNDISTADDDSTGGLTPVGRFVSIRAESGLRNNTTSRSNNLLEFHVGSNDLDRVWLPLWCRANTDNQNTQNSSECRGDQLIWPPLADVVEVASEARPMTGKSQALLLSVIAIFVAIVILAFGYWLIDDNQPKGSILEMLFRDEKASESKRVNGGWFSEMDEQNFLKIVHKFLLTPEITLRDSKESIWIELHCHMFPFPSCKFVHWLTALHQLKEMMFQYQTAVPIKNSGKGKQRGIILGQDKARGFFSVQHKGTATVRLLMNKYKCINECFCNLAQLNHGAIVAVHGVSLGYTVSNNKMVRLHLEQPSRGNLRRAMQHLRETMLLDECNAPKGASDEDPTARKAYEKFKEAFALSFIGDLLAGIGYLHSPVSKSTGFHGELRATTCMLTANWRLKLSGFHGHHMRRSLGNYEQQQQQQQSSRQNNNNSDTSESLPNEHDGLVYLAPEVLENRKRLGGLSCETLRVADIYSLGFVLYELIVGQEPWFCLAPLANAKMIAERVQTDSSFRPPLSGLDKAASALPCLDLDFVGRIIRACWSHTPERRPQTVGALQKRLESALCSAAESEPQTNRLIYDANTGQVIECYLKLSELVSQQRKVKLQFERARCSEMRVWQLPKSVADSMARNERIDSKRFECVSCCSFRFVLNSCDLDSINKLTQLLIELNRLVATYKGRVHLLDSQVDSLLHNLVYAGGPLGEPNKQGSAPFNQAQLLASFALQLIELVNRFPCATTSAPLFQVKCGLHCGPVLAGLVEIGERFAANSARYILMGETLQIANLLESTSQAQRIQISPRFRTLLQQPLPPMDVYSREEQRSSAPLMTTTTTITGVGQRVRQGYVTIKREGKIIAKSQLPTSIAGGSPSEHYQQHLTEAFWLLNGPRLSASQSVMLS